MHYAASQKYGQDRGLYVYRTRPTKMNSLKRGFVPKFAETD